MSKFSFISSQLQPSLNGLMADKRRGSLSLIILSSSSCLSRIFSSVKSFCQRIMSSSESVSETAMIATTETAVVTAVEDEQVDTTATATTADQHPEQNKLCSPVMSQLYSSPATTTI